MFDRIIELLLVAGGIGGAYTVYQIVIAVLSRRRIKVRFVGETYDPKLEPHIEIRLELEIINLGDKPTALAPSVKVSSLDALSRSPLCMELIIESERLLEPQTPTTIVASAVVGGAFVFSWYRRYKIPISRGRCATIRHFNAFRVDVEFFHYWIGYLRFRLSNDWLPDEAKHNPRRL